MKDNMLHMDHVTLGGCYYPEHWPENMWEDDLRRMKECGIEIVRIAEFAWNKFEPEEGVYTFEFFDRFMELAKKEEMKIIFCTPTATPPLWLSEKYPEILNADLDGNRYYHGTRRHYNLNSKVYHKFSRKITKQLAEHYAGHPNIIGWQLDNEINCEIDLYYSESDHEAFREYCKKKFKTLDNFNESMGTVFWNQTYTDWNQVHLTRRTNTYGHTNPHIQLEERRFISESAIEFFRLQADIIREYLKKYNREDAFITTNGLFGHLDYHKLVGEVLDFITFDNYPAFAFEDDLDPARTNGLKDRNSSYNLTRTRSISPTFGIMEQQTGAGGWNCRMKMPMPKPGQMRLWTLQAIAHGADYIGYFRWRTARFGTEIYWHGLHDYDNRENRRVRELKQIAEDVKKLKGLAGSKVQAEVAIIMDYDNEWDGENDLWHGPAERKSRDALFCALQKKHVSFDFLYIDDETTEQELAVYKTLIYPHATLLSEKRAAVLEEFIRQGGQVIFGCRTGYKDLRGQCVEMPMPGLAAKLCGCQVEEYTTISKWDVPMYLAAGEKKAAAPDFHDVLEVTDGEVMAIFESEGAVSHYEGKPAVVKKQIGKGFGWYVGSVFAEETAMFIMEMTNISMLQAYKDIFELPEEVEIVSRRTVEGDMIFLLNYEPKEVMVKTAVKKRQRIVNVLTGEEIEDACKIGAYNALIVKVSE